MFVKRIKIGRRNQPVACHQRWCPAVCDTAQDVLFLAGRRARAPRSGTQCLSAKDRRDRYFTSANPVGSLVQKLHRTLTGWPRCLFDMAWRNVKMLRNMSCSISGFGKADLIDRRDTVERVYPPAATVAIRRLKRRNHEAKRVVERVTIVDLAGADDHGNMGWIAVHSQTFSATIAQGVPRPSPRFIAG